MTEPRQTIAGAFDKIAAHEEICAIRYQSIEGTLAELKGEMRRIMWGVLSVLVAVAGWALVQLYNGHPMAQAQPAPAASHRTGG